MRFFTCTPVAFGGGADFFARDSGLLCRGFQSLGVESRAVMPGERRPEDDADLIRTEYGNLESAEWWRSHNLDGVVLYAWGRPKFRKVAAAIHNAGIFLVLNQDSGGLASPLAGPREWLAEQWILGGQGRGFAAWMRFLRLASRGMTVGLVVTDPLRAVHLGVGDIIACVSPKAAGHYRRLCRIYGGHDLAERVKVIPHAVESGVSCRRHFEIAADRLYRTLGGSHSKTDMVDDGRNRRLVDKDESLSVMIVGNVTPEMNSWHRSLGESQGTGFICAVIWIETPLWKFSGRPGSFTALRHSRVLESRRRKHCVAVALSWRDDLCQWRASSGLFPRSPEFSQHLMTRLDTSAVSSKSLGLGIRI